MRNFSHIEHCRAPSIAGDYTYVQSDLLVRVKAHHMNAIGSVATMRARGPPKNYQF